jgi:hypothetical protein
MKLIKVYDGHTQSANIAHDNRIHFNIPAG